MFFSNVKFDPMACFGQDYVHILIIKIVINQMEIVNIYAVIVISFILTIVASAVIYLLVEKRFINLAKQLINRRKIIS